MNYEKQNFEDGQILTAEALNKIEDGVLGVSEATNKLNAAVLGAGTFGGLEIAKGPVYEIEGVASIADSWKFTPESSYYLSYPTQNVDGYRRITENELELLVTTDNAVRMGSTVNGNEHCHYALVRLKDYEFGETTTPLGLLLFPDYLTIEGKELEGSDEEIITEMSESDIDNYVAQGCAFLLAAGECDMGEYYGVGSTGTLAPYYAEGYGPLLRWNSEGISIDESSSMDLVHFYVKDTASIAQRIKDLEESKSPWVAGSSESSAKMGGYGVRANGNGSVAFGVANAEDSEISANGSSLAFGCVEPYDAHVVANNGSLAFTQIGESAQSCTISALGEGSLAHGSFDFLNTIVASGQGATAEGVAGDPDYGYPSLVSSGKGSHAEGVSTLAQNEGEHAEGVLNVSHKDTDPGKCTQSSIGVGYYNEDEYYVVKRNAFEVMKNGEVYILGVGGYDGTNAGSSGILSLQEVIRIFSDENVDPSQYGK